MNPLRLTTLLLLLITVGCSGQKQLDPHNVVEVLNLASKLGYYDSVIGRVDEVFTPQELDWFENNKIAATPILIKYIEQGSTPAVLLAGYLRLEAAREPLRHKLLMLRGVYGWEGPDYSKAEAWLLDSQYPYHNLYINAIEQITQKPIHEAIKLTPAEYNSLQWESRNTVTYDTHPDVGENPPYINDKAWCAKWLLIQLKLLE